MTQCPSCAAGEGNAAGDAWIFRQRCEDLRAQLETQQELAAQKKRDQDRIISRKDLEHKREAEKWAQERLLLEARVKAAESAAAEVVKLRQLNTHLAVQIKGLTAATKLLCGQLEGD